MGLEVMRSFINRESASKENDVVINAIGYAKRSYGCERSSLFSFRFLFFLPSPSAHIHIAFAATAHLPISFTHFCYLQ
jgi:hypothetical protein